MKQQIQVTRQLSDFKDLLSLYFEDVKMVDSTILIVGSFIRLEQKSENLVTIEWRTDPMSDMVADNISTMLSCTDLSKANLDINALYFMKLELALRSRWSVSISYDSEHQVFRFAIDGNDVLIAYDPDKENGIYLECPNEQIAETINNIASKLYSYIKPIAFPY